MASTRTALIWRPRGVVGSSFATSAMAAYAEQRDVTHVDQKGLVPLQRLGQSLEQLRRDLADVAAAAADQVDVGLVEHSVIRRSAVRQVRVGDQSQLFQQLQRP